MQQDYERVVFISDIHAPFHDEKALQILYNFIKWFKPETVFIMGDLLDAYALSRFSKDPNGALHFQEEIDSAIKILGEIRAVCGKKAKIYYIRGNHECVDKRTELLCEDGWKNVTQVTEDDLVAQFNIKTGKISFTNPTNTIKKKSETVYVIENNAMKQIVSPGHEVVYDNKKYRADSLPKDLVSNKFRYSVISKFPKYNITDDWIRLLTWTVMDGTIINHAKYISNSNKIRIQFHLSKQNKIEALKKLLNRMGVKYTFSVAKKTGCNVLTPYYIRIYGDDARKIYNWLNQVKEIPSYFKEFNREQTQVLLETIIETDGSTHYSGYIWSSISKNNVDIVSYLMAKNGFVHKVRYITNKLGGFKSSKPQYHTRFWLYQPGQLQDLSVKEVPYNDYVYCVTMPEGTIVTRIDGKTAFTGNCRLQKFLWNNAKELSNLHILEVPSLLNLKRFNIEYVEKGMMMYKGVMIKHGTVVRKYAGYSAKAEFEKNGCSGVSGHTHRAAIYMHTNAGGNYKWMEVGCLCDLNQEYLEGETANWQQSFGIGYFHKKTSRYQLELVNIVDGKAMYAGKEFVC